MSEGDTLTKPRSWRLQIEKDENGDAMITLPPELLAELGWQEGDEICWRVEGRSAVLTKGPCECDEPVSD